MTLDAMPECTEKTAMGLEDQQRPAKSLRILLVEDHGDTLHALARLLTHFGHEISVADGAQNARKIIESKEFDVVLSDIGLPDGSGYELISEAKRKQPIKAESVNRTTLEPDPMCNHLKKNHESKGAAAHRTHSENSKGTPFFRAGDFAEQNRSASRSTRGKTFNFKIDIAAPKRRRPIVSRRVRQGDSLFAITHASAKTFRRRREGASVAETYTVRPRRRRSTRFCH